MAISSYFQGREDRDFWINRVSRTSWEMKAYHFHDFFELFFLLSGEVKYFVEDKVYDVKKGDLLVFNPFVLHRSVLPPGLTYERYVLCFKADYIKDFSPVCEELLEIFQNSAQDFDSIVHLPKEKMCYNF